MAHSSTPWNRTGELPIPIQWQRRAETETVSRRPRTFRSSPSSSSGKAGSTGERAEQVWVLTHERGAGEGGGAGRYVAGHKQDTPKEPSLHAGLDSVNVTWAAPEFTPQ